MAKKRAAAKKPRKERKPNRYKAIIERIFFENWSPGERAFEFERHELKTAAAELGVELPDNLGDNIYSFRFRTALPDRIIETQPEGLIWTIQGAGKGRYRFRLVKDVKIEPNPSLLATSIPDATPELIGCYALDDEQALLAVVRYNRLVDTFLGLTTYSLQSHLRTSVKGVGQIEVDELYVGIDKRGCHYVIPVQAKGGKDKIGLVQIEQDVLFAAQKFPGIRCRPVAAQFMTDGTIALFELALHRDEVKIVEERHYRLVAATELDGDAIRDYRP